MWNLAPYIRNILLYESSFRSVLAKNKPYSRKNLVSENHIRGRQCIDHRINHENLLFDKFSQVFPLPTIYSINFPRFSNSPPPPYYVFVPGRHVGSWYTTCPLAKMNSVMCSRTDLFTRIIDSINFPSSPPPPYFAYSINFPFF